MNCWKPKPRGRVISSRAVPIRQTAGVQKGSETIPQGSRDQAISKYSPSRNGWNDMVRHSVKAEMWLTTAGGSSDPLNRSDELIFEVDIDALDEVYRINSDLMIRAVKSVMPGVLIKVEGEAMTRWSKAAEPTFDEQGRLIPVEIAI